MVVLILRLFSETLQYKDRLNRSLRSKVVYKACAAIVMIAILGKQNVDYMTGKGNILRSAHTMRLVAGTSRRD